MLIRKPKSVVLALVAWGGCPIAVDTLRPGRPFGLAHTFQGIEALAQALRAGESVELIRGDFEICLAHISLDRSWRPNLVAALFACLAVEVFCFLAVYAIVLGPIPTEIAQRPLVGPRLVLVAEPGPESSDLGLDPTGPPVRCGDREMGRADVAADGRYGVPGPRDNPDPHLARTRSTNREQSDYQSYSRPDSPTAPWARDDASGTDPESGRGALWPDRISDGRGSDGLGLARPVRAVPKQIDWIPCVFCTAL